MEINIEVPQKTILSHHTTPGHIFKGV
jgi:hypothetical protein